MLCSGGSCQGTTHHPSNQKGATHASRIISIFCSKFLTSFLIFVVAGGIFMEGSMTEVEETGGTGTCTLFGFLHTPEHALESSLSLSRILAWEDGFCNFAASSCEQAMTEEECQLKGLQPELFFKMSHEIYNYGEGWAGRRWLWWLLSLFPLFDAENTFGSLIGKVAADHSHKWVFKEPQDHKMVLLSTWNNPADSVSASFFACELFCTSLVLWVYLLYYYTCWCVCGNEGMLCCTSNRGLGRLSFNLASR